MATALVLGVLIFVLALGQSPVTANGGVTQIVKNERAGPYELQVGILPGSPKVGTLHLSMLVSEAATGNLITNATVTLTAEGPEGSTPVGPLPMNNLPQTPQYYDANIPLDMEGSWLLTMEIDAPPGQGDLAVPLQVTSGGGISLALVAAAVVALLAVSIWSWDRIKKVQHRKSRNQRR